MREDEQRKAEKRDKIARRDFVVCCSPSQLSSLPAPPNPRKDRGETFLLFPDSPLDPLDQDGKQEDARQDCRSRQRLLEVVKHDRNGVLDLRES